MRILFFVLAAVFFCLGILFLPKQKPVQQAPQTILPSPVSEPIPAPTPKPIKLKPSVTLDRSREYTRKENFEWNIFLPPESGWVDVGQRLIMEKSFPGYGNHNVLIFETKDWIETYLIRVGNSEIQKPDSDNYRIFPKNNGDCLPVYIKNVSDHDLSLRMRVNNYPYHYNPPSCN